MDEVVIDDDHGAEGDAGDIVFSSFRKGADEGKAAAVTLEISSSDEDGPSGQMGRSSGGGSGSSQLEAALGFLDQLRIGGEKQSKSPSSGSPFFRLWKGQPPHPYDDALKRIGSASSHG